MNPCLPPGTPAEVAHQASMSLMRSHPLTPAGDVLTYAAAAEVVRGDAPMPDPNAEPWYHPAAMAHMRSHPGLSYDAAVREVITGRRGR